jgi:hypothetical protein
MWVSGSDTPLLRPDGRLQQHVVMSWFMGWQAGGNAAWWVGRVSARLVKSAGQLQPSQTRCWLMVTTGSGQGRPYCFAQLEAVSRYVASRTGREAAGWWARWGGLLGWGLMVMIGSWVKTTTEPCQGRRHCPFQLGLLSWYTGLGTGREAAGGWAG